MSGRFDQGRDGLNRCCDRGERRRVCFGVEDEVAEEFMIELRRSAFLLCADEGNCSWKMA